MVTSISIDHTEFLGPTIAKIAYEKAGIFKAGVPAILSVQHDDAHKVLRFEAARAGAPAIDAGRAIFPPAKSMAA